MQLKLNEQVHPMNQTADHNMDNLHTIFIRIKRYQHLAVEVI